MKLACKTLDPSCVLCNGTDYCTHCTGNLVALGPTCQINCPDGTYNETGICTGKLFSCNFS